MKGLLAALLLLPASAGAAVTVAGGAAFANIHNNDGVAPVMELAVETPAGIGVWRANVAYLGTQDVTTDEGVDGTLGAFWVAGGQLVYQAPMGPLTYELGVGGAWRSHASNIEYLLPAKINFNITMGLKYRQAFIEWRHLSNGFTQNTNRGENWVQVGWTF